MRKIFIFLFIMCSVINTYAQQKKEYIDSLYSTYRVYAYFDSSEVVQTYTYSEKKEKFLLVETSVSYREDNRLQQYCLFDENGDSSVKVLYSYADTNNDVEYLRYKYSLNKAKLTHKGHFYNAKFAENEFIRLLNSFLTYDVNLCDSFHLTIYGLIDVPMNGTFFGDLVACRPDSLHLQTNILGVSVNIRAYLHYNDSLLTDTKVTISALDGKIDTDLLYVRMTYNEDNQLSTLEVLPLKTPVYNLYKDMKGFSLRTYQYRGKQLFCFTEYNSPSKDTVNIEYNLYQRTYYTYQKGKLDSAYIYTKYQLNPQDFDTSALVSVSPLDVIIYPNPAENTLFISGLEKETEIEIYSEDGRKVIYSRLSESENNISIATLSSGMYWVKLQQGASQCVKKLIKK